MKNPKHTPGIWTHFLHEGGDYVITTAPNSIEGCIADVYAPKGFTKIEAESNARLMSLAPQLFHALKCAHEKLPYGNDALDLMITQLINKAVK